MIHPLGLEFGKLQWKGSGIGALRGNKTTNTRRDGHAKDAKQKHPSSHFSWQLGGVLQAAGWLKGQSLLSLACETWQCHPKDSPGILVHTSYGLHGKLSALRFVPVALDAMM